MREMKRLNKNERQIEISIIMVLYTIFEEVQLDGRDKRGKLARGGGNRRSGMIVTEIERDSITSRGSERENSDSWW